MSDYALLKTLPSLAQLVQRIYTILIQKFRRYWMMQLKRKRWIQRNGQDPGQYTAYRKLQLSKHHWR
jgi:hypothetical protein